jgi:opacity protein-like surface antigen
MVAPQWSAKLEYLHADYGTYESRTNLVPTSPWTAKLTSDSVKVGVNYHGDILGALFR